MPRHSKLMSDRHRRIMEFLEAYQNKNQTQLEDGVMLDGVGFED